jgi:hypothetical protein
MTPEEIAQAYRDGEALGQLTYTTGLSLLKLKRLLKGQGVKLRTKEQTQKIACKKRKEAEARFKVYDQMNNVDGLTPELQERYEEVRKKKLANMEEEERPVVIQTVRLRGRHNGDPLY